MAYGAEISGDGRYKVQLTQITGWGCPPLPMRNPGHLGQRSGDSDGVR